MHLCAGDACVFPMCACVFLKHNVGFWLLFKNVCGKKMCKRKPSQHGCMCVEAAQANRERIFLCAQSFCRNASDTSMLVSSFIFPAAARGKILLLIFKPHSSSSSSSNSLENPEMRPPPPPAAMSNLLWRHFLLAANALKYPLECRLNCLLSGNTRKNRDNKHGV